MADHIIEWYHPERGGRGPESSTGAVVSHLPETKEAVERAARTIGLDAEMELLKHRDKGHAYIEIEAAPPHLLDTYVVLQDRAPANSPDDGYSGSAAGIEFGFRGHKGLHILGGAMKRATRAYRGK